METSLLKTKLNPPPLRQYLVSRPGLQQKLEHCIHFNLTLISAPAGFGKTTLISQWAHRNVSALPIAWLSLDKSDDDPVRFWLYFTGALRDPLEIDTEEIETLVKSPDAAAEPDMESFITVLVNTLLQRHDDFVIVLDDYHCIESPSIHRSLIFLLEHLPPKAHIVIATREDPPFPLARFHGKGSVLAITDDDLRFSLQDAARLLGEYRAPSLSDDELRALNERTEGWAVGLKMAAQSLTGHPDASDFIRSFTGSQSYIMDYLLEEVLQNQAEDTRAFLLTTSILERMTGPLCDALTGESDGRERLALLEKANLFIQPLDEERIWYRYEHLFADLLQHQLLISYGKDRLLALHRQAAGWYETNGHLNQAVEHGLLAEDWESVVRLLELPEMDHARTAEAVTQIKWIKQLPPELLLAHPDLVINFCQMLAASGQLEEAEGYLKNIKRAADLDPVLKGKIAITRVYIAKWGPSTTDYREAVKRAIDMVDESDTVQRAVLTFELAWLYLVAGEDFDRAEALAWDAYRYARESGTLFLEMNGAAGVSTFEMQKGALRSAADICLKALDRAGDAPVTITPHINLGIINYEWNNLAEASQHLQTALEFGRKFGIMQARAYARDYLSFIRYAQGDSAGARELAEQADFQAYRVLSSEGVRGGHACFRLLFSIWYGKPEEANAWSERLEADAKELRYCWRIIPVRQLIFEGRKGEASAALKAMLERAESGEAPIDPVQLHLYRALAAETEHEALEFLEVALAKGEPEGYVRTFVDEQRALKPLLRKALARGIHPDFVRMLLAAMDKEAVLRKSGQTDQTILSARELEILQLMAAATPNQEIGERLAISLSTVKTHVHHILEKLEAADRSQAVYRARELGIL